MVLRPKQVHARPHRPVVLYRPSTIVVGPTSRGTRLVVSMVDASDFASGAMPAIKSAIFWLSVRFAGIGSIWAATMHQ